MNCLFCKIANNEIPASIVYQDDEVVGFNDINPQAPLHILLIPRQHIASTNQLERNDAEIIGKLVLAAQQVAAEQGIAEEGYRLVMNCNRHGGQSVFHIHLHLLAGRQMRWPPG